METEQYGSFLGLVPIIGILVFLGIYVGSPLFGSYNMRLRKIGGVGLGA